MASSRGAPRMRILPPALVIQNDESPADSTNSAAGGGGGAGGATPSRQAGAARSTATPSQREERSSERMTEEYTAGPTRAVGAKGATAACPAVLHFIFPLPGYARAVSSFVRLARPRAHHRDRARRLYGLGARRQLGQWAGRIRGRHRFGPSELDAARF